MPPRHWSRSVESSSSHVDTPAGRVRRGVGLWNEANWEAALEDLSPEIEWRNSGAVPGIDDVYHGHDGVRRFWHTWTEAWESIRIEIEEMVEQPTAILVYARFKARARDGIEVDQPLAFQFSFDDSGRTVRFQSYWNRDDVPLDARTTAGPQS
jgi:ketosteroid isomerase-like protein